MSNTGTTISEFEREYIRRAIEKAHGNLSEAARASGLDRKNFWVLAKRYGLLPSQPERARGVALIDLLLGRP